MNTKKIPLPSKPNNKSPSVDAWVNNKEIVKNKRLTIDIPEYLHKKIKSSCALRGNKISDEIRELLIKKYE